MSTPEYAMLIALGINLLAGGFWGGRVSAKVSSLDRRMERIENHLLRRHT